MHCNMRTCSELSEQVGALFVANQYKVYVVMLTLDFCTRLKVRKHVTAGFTTGCSVGPINTVLHTSTPLV